MISLKVERSLGECDNHRVDGRSDNAHQNESNCRSNAKRHEESNGVCRASKLFHPTGAHCSQNKPNAASNKTNGKRHQAAHTKDEVIAYDRGPPSLGKERHYLFTRSDVVVSIETNINCKSKETQDTRCKYKQR